MSLFDTTHSVAPWQTTEVEANHHTLRSAAGETIGDLRSFAPGDRNLILAAPELLAAAEAAIEFIETFPGGKNTRMAILLKHAVMKAKQG